MPFVVDMNITLFIIGIQQQHFSVNQFWSDLFLLLITKCWYKYNVSMFVQSLLYV